MVLETENPNFKLASCCNVEVVNGAVGDFLAGFFVTETTLKLCVEQAFKKSVACFSVSKLFESFALTFEPFEINSASVR